MTNRSSLSRLLNNGYHEGHSRVHILGAILSLAIAAIVSSVLLSEHQALPGWAILLCAVAIIVMIANAVRVYRNGVERIRRNEGPRTRIVLTDSSPPPPPTKDRQTADD